MMTGEVRTARPGKSRVLVVDDEPQVLLALEDILSDEYEVLKAGSAAAALRLLEAEQDVAVVVSDQRMPGMTGDELLARLSESSDAMRVMVTGYAELAAVIRAVNNGRIFAFVRKPWDGTELRMTIRKCVEHFELVRRLAHERQLLEDLMSNVPDAIYFKDRELRFTRMNAACAAHLTLEDAKAGVGRRLGDLALPAAYATAFEREEAAIIDEGKTVSDVIDEHTLGSERRFYSTTIAPVRARSGSIQGLVGISRDVTARMETERALRRLTHVRTMLGAVNGAIVRVKERELLLKESCRIAVEEGGLLASAFVLTDCETGEVPTAVAADAAADLGALLVSNWGTRSDGNAWSCAACLRDGRPSVAHALAHDAEDAATSELVQRGCRSVAAFPLVLNQRVMGCLVLASRHPDFFDGEEVRLLSELTENIVLALDHIEKSERLDFLACSDDLTGLPKRELFLDRVRQFLTGRRSAGGRAAVALVDVSRLRQVNETLGRRGGDDVLSEVGSRLSAILEERDTLARFDGSTFALMLGSVADDSEASSSVRRIFSALSTPFLVRGAEIRLTVRVGVAMFPSDASSADELVRNAEAALVNAKTTGQRSLFYAPSMNARVGERLTLETRLRRALEEQQFCLHYQPKMDLESGVLVGLEALIRWNDPERGLVQPAEFIPLLEETGLILDVGAWVLEAAAEQYAEWSAAGSLPPRIAVNVSSLQLAEAGFVRSVEQAFERYPTARGGLDIELTESVLMRDLLGNIEKLRQLKTQGVSIAIDDFGTGYSSLGYLSRLPIDALKIDRSFIIRMADDTQDMTIVTTIISLAHALEMKVIAEGVETREQARLLKFVKCNEIQGYLFGRPQSAGEIEPRFRETMRTWPPPSA
jgi:diguanylate cyclase (GGDEF)-like protein